MLEDAAIRLIEQTLRLGLPHFGRPCRFLLAPPFRRSFTLLSVRACFDVHRVTRGGVQVLLDPEIPLCGADLCQGTLRTRRWHQVNSGMRHPSSIPLRKRSGSSQLETSSTESQYGQDFHEHNTARIILGEGLGRARSPVLARPW
jgi:hypothetical protein